MERLAKAEGGPSKTLSAPQKARLAGIDTLYKGKIAEREIFLRKRMTEAQASGDPDEIEKIRTQLQAERARLEEEREDEKEKVRRER